MNISRYLDEVDRIYRTGSATEHSYRAALEGLFNSVAKDVEAVNEPKAVKVGRPDFVFLRRSGEQQITIGHCEAKDIGVDIAPKTMSDANKKQHQRYVRGLPNLMYTNCLDFRFYKNGELVRDISIADMLMGIQPKPDRFDALVNQLEDFASQKLQTITSPEELAERMAGKASIIKDVLYQTLKEDKEKVSELAGQFKAFQDQLIHTLREEEFADIYAETIAYGLFGARLHDESKHDFSREEALDLLPKSNPFLRNLFSFIAGTGLGIGLRRSVDELAEIFQAVDLAKLFENFGAFTQKDDPFIHFYEDFLAKYNPAKRKARGVWYTPEPVVRFIVRAVDDVLRQEFGLAQGLADTAKVTVDWDTGETGGKSGDKEVVTTQKRDLHRVQILDPAAGTGTFLAEVIKQIAPKVKDIAPGQWNGYVEKELIPRLHGFELLMASYAMCHTKLDMMLNELEYKTTREDPPRLGVYLTNSLEEGSVVKHYLGFAQWLANEANHANTVKRNVPVMCVIGNPPYSGESANKGPWIQDLIDVYKKEPGGQEKLKERNPKWLNDDYVKFIRFAEYMIEKNGEGVLGFITNHGYLDNPTFRGMRWHLLKTFDKIHVLDLHGNAKKKEIAPDGSADKNVFDIQQGVAIVIAVKKRTEVGADKALARVYHGDLWGTRQEKYKALDTKRVVELCDEQLEMRPPHYLFVKRDFELQEAYEKGFSLTALMPVNSVGIVTARDALTIDMHRDVLWQRVRDFACLEPEQARAKYALGKDVRDWRVEWAQKDITNNMSSRKLQRIAYRPFDPRWTYYTGHSRGFLCYPRSEVMRHMLNGENVGLATARSNKNPFPNHFFISDKIAETKYSESSTQSALFPLYLYPDDDAEQADALAPTERTVNMEPSIRTAIADAGEDKAHGRPDEMAIFDYIYGVLHCPAYRETYKEFLKSDFPRIPYPSSPGVFWDISEKGGHLRRLHLIDDDAIGKTPYPFHGEGESVVEKPYLDGERVFINKTQYFDNVPQVAWTFFIGGYQPAQKWLKDRKGRTLTFEDIRHYQKIIKILEETHRIMDTIPMPHLV